VIHSSCSSEVTTTSGATIWLEVLIKPRQPICSRHKHVQQQQQGQHCVRTNGMQFVMPCYATKSLPTHMVS
jgi:hypothetical protein